MDHCHFYIDVMIRPSGLLATRRVFFVSKMGDICYHPASMTQFSVSIPDPITSAVNAEVKSLRALHERKYRKKSGWFLAEGARICREAVALGWDIHRLAFLAGRETDVVMRPC